MNAGKDTPVKAGPGPTTDGRKLMEAIVSSMKGVEHDYTRGSIKRAVVLLSIPMILELCLESVFAVVDMFFVGKLGENAIATVGLTESVITIVYSFAIGLSTAATAIVARRVGEKSYADAGIAGIQAIGVGAAITVVLSFFGAYFAEEILAMMGASEAVVKDGAIFTRIMFAGSISIVMLFLINGIFRGAGDAAMAMKSLWLASIVNIILCPILIHYWGLKGAAIATVIGRSTGVAYQCFHLARGTGMVRFTRALAAPQWDVIRSVIRIASPATLQFLIASGSWIVLARYVAEFGGTTASAGYQIAVRNVVFFILPAWGLSNAAATLVGQNLGAQELDRAEKSVTLSAKYNAIFMLFVTLLFVGIPGPIIGIFSADPEVIAFGSQALRYMGAGFVFYGIGMVMIQSLNGAGDTRTPTVINFCCYWLFQVPFAYLLGKYFKMGVTGVFLAIPVAETLAALVAWWFFAKGKWKTVKV